MDLTPGDDGLLRCSWGTTPELYRVYHDEEWGRPVTDDIPLFEKLCLEGFQSGLSWLTILRKRDSFRSAFAGFDPDAVSLFGEHDVGRLLGDAGIVRHEGKIRSVINNAKRCLELIEESGSLGAYVWGRADEEDDPPGQVVTTSPAAIALAKDLKRRGWTFVGPTTAHAFMQAMGLVNDHLAGCHVREECSRLRRITVKGRI